MSRMQMFVRPLTTLALATVLAGSATAQNTVASAAERGSALLADYKIQLQGALQHGLQQGIVEAIDVCHSAAPEIANSLSENGVLMGRSSHRLRNPESRTPAWAQATLETYLADAEHRQPQVVEISESRWGYVEPIGIQPLCTTCHGTVVAPAIEEKIAELYPLDQATGFNLGDLRGIFWVEFPVTP